MGDAGHPKARLSLWRDGTPTLGPETDPYGDFTAVSTTGIAVGSAHEGSQRRAVAFAYGRSLTLPLPAGADESAAAAVNARGDVAGSVYADGQPQRAGVWAPDGAALTLPTPPGFTFTAATHIDDDGSVLGYAATGSPSMPERTRLVVWAADGTPRVLPTTGPVDPEPMMSPIDFHHGIVYGTQEGELVRWDLAARTTTVVDTGGAGGVEAVNAGGSMVLFGGFGQDGLVFVRDGVVRPLNDGGRWITPVALTDDDLVFGRSNMNASPAYMDCR